MNNNSQIQDVIITSLKKIDGVKGNVYHGIKKSDSTFKNFGELYFSSVDYLSIKGWKQHTKMTMNLIPLSGRIKLVIYDSRDASKTKKNFFEINLSIQSNFVKVTVPPKLWFGFQGLEKDHNLLLNLADIEHDPDETQNIDLESIPYNWD